MVYLITLLVISIGITIFVSKELLKKFGFAKQFIDSSKQLIRWKYIGDKKSGMYNIVLRSDKDFSVLVGFMMPLFQRKGYDRYGFAKSDETHTIVISSHLNHKPTEFVFLLNKDIQEEIVFSCSQEDQILKSQVIYKPHWRQRIGIG